ncbi:ferritin-like domain-containing protein [Brevibacillus ruminantium]|uniref:Ferritin-like domain-containing protein n=1 Tax=Brevibacillus ruminantium TaxID=2950604 RepID=A0ABY4WFB8_9BACL|nr:ferritin-like domain-containing protein [Brevibacillus ruminantium]USG64495.1 ferritin-like domain-containing protein [Brevibacillus ruminantium]
MNGYWYGPYGYSTYAPIRPVSMDRYDDRTEVVIRLIQEGIAGERNDELFYDYLISVAPTQQEKDVITGIRDDERKHRRLFRQLYTQLSGQQPGPIEEGEMFHKPASYLAGLEQALLGELKAFEKYRTIYRYIPQQYRDTVFEIMTDELKHAGYYNWLYAKNK